MTYRMLSIAIFSALATAGCPAADDGGGDTGAATEGTGATTSGTTPSTMTMSTTATTAGDDDAMDASASGDDMADDTADTMPPTTGNPTTGDPTTGDPTTGDPTTGDPTTGDPTGGNNAGPCEVDAMDDECAQCVKTNCCMELEACALDAGCTCFQDCVEKNPGQLGAIQCGTECNVMLFGVGPTADLVGCSSSPPCATPCV